MKSNIIIQGCIFPGIETNKTKVINLNTGTNGLELQLSELKTIYIKNEDLAKLGYKK